MFKLLIFFFFFVFFFAITGYELFYFLFNEKITILNLVLINLLVFYVSILFGIITITLAKLVGDLFLLKNFKHICYCFFFYNIFALGFKEYISFWFKNLFFPFFLMFCSLLFSSIQYVYFKNENNSSIDVCTQFSGFFDLFFKYLTVFSIILFCILVFIKF